MVGASEQVRLDVVARANLKGLNMIFGPLKKMQTGFKDISEVSIPRTATGLRDIGKEANMAAKRAGRLRKEAKAFKAEYLSVMFAGMAMQRFFGGFISSAFQTFNTVTEGTEMANNAVTRLHAAWEFFKFSLIEALMSSPLFMGLVNMVTLLIDKISGVSSGWRRVIVFVTIALAAIGAFLFVMGQVFLGVQGISMIFGPIVDKIWMAIKATKTWGIISAWVGGIWTALDKFMAAKVGKSWLLKFGLLGGAILAVVGVAFLLKKKFGSWGDAMKAWAAAIVLAITAIVQFSLNSIINLIGTSLQLLKGMLIVAQKAASFLGLDSFASKIGGAIEAINKIQNFKVDLLGPVAQKLDDLGFNPRPVEQRTPTQNTQPMQTEQTATGQQINIENLNIDTFDSKGFEVFEQELERQGLSTNFNSNF